MNNAKRKPRRRQDMIFCLLLLASCFFLWNGIYIHAKARVAQWLLENSWHNTLRSGGEISRPWPWADTWPIARLKVPSQEQDLIVLAADSGQSLAFGPGASEASSRIGENGMVVIGGHRDTHFGFLENVSAGDLLHLQDVRGRWFAYRVSHLNIANSRLLRIEMSSESPKLTLVTCYPFNAINPGGDLRYLVTADRVML